MMWFVQTKQSVLTVKPKAQIFYVIRFQESREHNVNLGHIQEHVDCKSQVRPNFGTTVRTVSTSVQAVFTTQTTNQFV
jgi:hypothetical protein